MKFLIIIILLSSSALSILAQPQVKTEEQIKTLYQHDKFYDVIATQDYYYRTYPTAIGYSSKDWIQYMRLSSWLAMNDMINLRKDLNRYLTTDPGFAKKVDTILTALTNKKFFAHIAAQEFITDPVLDSMRDYRPLLTYCDTVRGALNPARTCYDVEFYDLSLTVLPETKEIEGNNKIFFSITEPTSIIQLDLFDRYQVQSVKMNGTELKYVRNCQALMIDLAKELLPGEKACIEIIYSGIPIEAPKPPWNGGFTWKENKGRHWVGVSCENLGASSWWPMKDHLSDKPDSLRITLRVPSGYQAVSNGNLRNVKPNDDQTTSFEWFVGYPINSYNVTFYMGDFVNISETYTDDSSSYQVDYYVLENHLKKAKKYYSTTKDILRAYTELFGEYPFPDDGAGFVEAPFAGMEHQGAIAIGDEYKKRSLFYNSIPENAYILVHETAHEWWGNAVAVGDMADAWINEGFATYAEYLFMEKLYGYNKYLETFGNRSQFIFNTWPMVGDRDVNDNTFISGDIYNKGAAMLNNLRCIINNDSLFFGIIKGFYQEYKLKITNTNDFIAFVRKHYPVDLTDFFNVFLYSDDPPILEYSYVQAAGKLLFSYHWTGVGRNFTMPFALMVNDTTCLRMNGTTTVQRFTINGAGSFYIPNPYYFYYDILDPNTFTYFETYWKRD
jgi:aminopeptidase N